jgi:hypothetical protein
VLLLPAVAAGQGSYAVDANGCIVGRPCAFGVPLPAPTQGTYAVDGEGCVIGQPCSWRGWRTDTTKTSIDRTSGNVYETTRHPDGTTDSKNFNLRTGSIWDQHTDARTNVEYGHDKSGRFWSAPLTAPRFDAPETSAPGPDILLPTNELEPSAHDIWLKNWWNSRGQPLASNFNGQDWSTANGAEQRQQLFEAYAQEAATQRERDHDISAVLSRMQPGSLAAAARSVAHDRCVALPNEIERASCIEAANKK